MIFKVAVVDDEENIRESYKNMFARYSSETGEQARFDVSFFVNGLDFVSNYKKGFDLIFLDVDMPALNGFEAAGVLRKMDEHVILVFVTRLAKYAINGYQYGATDFIVKPLDYATFRLKMRRLIKKLDARTQKTICITCDNTAKILQCSEIKYVEVLGHHIIFHTKDGNYQTYGTLSEIMKELDDGSFFMCHRSYYVNAAYVSELKTSTIVVGGEELPVSRLRRKEISDIIVKYVRKNG